MPTPRPLLLLASCSSFLASLSAAPFELAKPIESANGVVMKEFAEEPFMRNTVGICVDKKGRVYASSMLLMGLLLQKRELRDVMAYLQSLK